MRAAEEANRAVSDDVEAPSGTLRVTADPVFGEAFLTGLIVEYAQRWPEVSLDVVSTRRRVDLIEEGFHVAFRIGGDGDAALAGPDLGSARVRYCASPEYLARRGAPDSPAQLAVNGIADLNDRGEFDLLVLGLSGPPRAARRLIRGVTATLRKRLPIPVLSVRQPTEDSPNSASGVGER